MRIALLLICLPALAWADDRLVRGDVAAALVYPGGATTTRVAGATLPAGAHRLLIPLPGATRTPDIALSGATLVNSALLRNSGIDLEALDTEAQAAARAALEAAEDASAAAQLGIEAAEAAFMAAETRLTWLSTLTRGGEGGLDAPRDTERMVALLDGLGAQTGAAAADRVAARAEVEAAREVLEDARKAETEARAALDRLRPLPQDTPLLSLSLSLSAEGPVEVAMQSFDYTASWSPRYDLRLDTEAGTLALDRKVALVQSSQDVWTDVALTLSTADPNRGTDPADPLPTPAYAVDPQQQFRRMLQGSAASRIAPLEEMEVAPAELGVDAINASPVAPSVIQGLSVTYPYPLPVSLEPGAEAVLALDTLDLDVEIENRAVPRVDRTAFLVARITNGAAEPILPGEATLYRDGDRIGEIFLPELAAGAETQLGYGPLDQLQLRWTRLERGEGDSGVFRRSSTLREAVAFEVENVSDSTEELRVLYSLPFSEQEDVGVEVVAEPRPDLIGWSDRRGVASWTMTLATGEKRRVELTFEIDWPEELEMTWQP